MTVPHAMTGCPIQSGIGGLAIFLCMSEIFSIHIPSTARPSKIRSSFLLQSQRPTTLISPITVSVFLNNLTQRLKHLNVSGNPMIFHSHTAFLLLPSRIGSDMLNNSPIVFKRAANQFDDFGFGLPKRYSSVPPTSAYQSSGDCH